MPPDNANSLPRLLDLRLRIQDCEDSAGRKDLRVDLRIHRTEIASPDGEIISVELRKVTLGLDLEGFETVATSHLGEPVKDLKVIGKQTTTLKTSAAGKATAKAGASLTDLIPVKLSLSAEAIVEAKASSTLTSKQDLSEHRVKARGGDTWEVCELPKPSGASPGPLDGTYLIDNVLCKVSPHKGANLKRVTLEAYTRQRDINLQFESGSLLQTFVNPSQEKLFKILVAKSLGLVGNKYAGIVRLSRSETEIED